MSLYASRVSCWPRVSTTQARPIRGFAGTLRRLRRVITFKSFQRGPEPPREKFVSDRSSTWELLKSLVPHDLSELGPPSPSEAAALKALGCRENALLAVSRPPDLPSPFQYHSTTNGDPSYVSQPRLSVSKVLTAAWCELRTYFEVFAGLPAVPKLRRMKSGTAYHARLEETDYPAVDMGPLLLEIERYIRRLTPSQQRDAAACEPVYELAHLWIELAARIVQMALTKRAREILVHGFLDLEQGMLATNESAFGEAVLVNGIADVLSLDAVPGDKLPTTLGAPWDFERELIRAKQTFSDLSQTHRLCVADVKTRASNSIPPQALVVDAAKLQCMYYGQFLYNLSRSAEFAYASCLENIRRRGVDPDAPLNPVLATKLIVAHFGVMVNDCLALASKPNPLVSNLAFSLAGFVSESEFRGLVELHHGGAFSIDSMDLSPLFEEWGTPLTFAYVARRAGQAFNALEAFEPSLVTVEYHNVRTKLVIATKQAKFDRDRLQQSIMESGQFWSGRRAPRPTEDHDRCKYCDFRGRCPALNA